MHSIFKGWTLGYLISELNNNRNFWPPETPERKLKLQLFLAVQFGIIAILFLMAIMAVYLFKKRFSYNMNV